MITLAGYGVVLIGDVSPAEQNLLSTLPDLDSAPRCTVTLLPLARPRDAARDGEDAVVSSAPPLLVVQHPNFEGSLDLEQRTATLYRRAESGYALHAFLRLVTTTLIALDGGLPLHCAATLFDDEAVIFFGRSGAGKSTISRALALPVLSDELIYYRDGCASASGFWGSLEPERRTRIDGSFKVRAAISLNKGAPLQLRPLEVAEALPLLLAVTLVPKASALWQSALQNVIAFAEQIPIYSLTWSLDDAPLATIRETLGKAMQ